MCVAKSHVRFTPEMCGAPTHVCFGPIADIVHCSNLATDLKVEKAGKSFSQAASGAKYLT
jgi:hypothetical protein